MQHKMLKFMTIFFGIMFYKVAAGLCIYFISSSIWGMCERMLLPKKKTTPGVPEFSTAATATTNTAVTATPPKWKGKTKKEKDQDKDKEKANDKTPATTFEKLKALWRDILKAAEKK